MSDEFNNDLGIGELLPGGGPGADGEPIEQGGPVSGVGTPPELPVETAGPEPMPPELSGVGIPPELQVETAGPEPMPPELSGVGIPPEPQVETGGLEPMPLGIPGQEWGPHTEPENSQWRDNDIAQVEALKRQLIDVLEHFSSGEYPGDILALGGEIRGIQGQLVDANGNAKFVSGGELTAVIDNFFKSGGVFETAAAADRDAIDGTGAANVISTALDNIYNMDSAVRAAVESGALNVDMGVLYGGDTSEIQATAGAGQVQTTDGPSVP